MRADRLLSILLLLQSRGKLTAQTLAGELEVSRRTILRDLDALSQAGVPVYAEGGHGGGIALDEHYRTSLTGLNAAEIQALFVASSPRLLDEIGLGRAARTSLEKLSAALPLPHQTLAANIRQRIYIDPFWWWHANEPLPFWEDLQQAVFEDRLIQAGYQRYSGEQVERTLEPYGLVAKSSDWYLVARRNGQFRIYRVSRFQQVRLGADHFNREPGFDLPAFWESHLDQFAESMAEYRFTLRVHPDRLKFVQRLAVGRCQVLEPMGADGWATVRVQFESLELAKMLVFGLGGQGRVVEPAGLRDAVRADCREILINSRKNRR